MVCSCPLKIEVQGSVEKSLFLCGARFELMASCLLGRQSTA
jgi:hypothetical protein